MSEDKFIDDLKLHIKRLTNRSFFMNEFSESIFYSLFNYGKCFRSKLLYRVAHDRGISPDKNLFHLAAFLEIHHCYTLIHDDLPCMDDDEFRRGKLTSHKKFNESIAVLAGDSLLHFSFEVLSTLDIVIDFAKKINKVAYWATGAKGLLLGQYLDLNEEKNSIEQIWRIHELKTARLIQLPFLWTSFLSQNSCLESLKTNLRIGSILGILFQILDDFEECIEGDIQNDKHEEEINLFQEKFAQQTLIQLEKLLSNLKSNFNKDIFPLTYPMIEKYIQRKVEAGIQKNITEKNLKEAISLFKSF